jgi:DNA topoisomerase-1
METKLDEVEENKVIWHELVKNYYEELMNLLNKVDVKKSKQEFIEETDIVCDVCKEGKMVIRHSKNGEFLSCSRFPACKNTKKFIRDDKGNIVIVEPQTLEEKCPKCGSPLIERKGKYGEFIACSNYPKCKYSRNKTTGVTCPECGKGELIQRRNKKGNIFYSCNRYPECKFISSYKPLPISCPECGNPYLVEKKTREGDSYKECPKCKSRME